MFCPELIASLSFTPVAAGVILLPGSDGNPFTTGTNPAEG